MVFQMRHSSAVTFKKQAHNVTSRVNLSVASLPSASMCEGSHWKQTLGPFPFNCLLASHFFAQAISESQLFRNVTFSALTLNRLSSASLGAT